MRPALLRLLKRPSALSVIDTLLSSPSGTEPLKSELTRRCIRCQSSYSRPQNPQHEKEANEPSKQPIKPLRLLRTRSVQPPKPKALHNHNDNSGSRSTAPNNWKELLLQPGRLDYESNIGHTHDTGTRLVDDPIHRNDLSLWLELLLYRKRHYGSNGTLQILNGLMTRVGEVQLPVDGEAADIFWQTFVDLGLEQEAILHEVVFYALQQWTETGTRWSKLYQSIVGKLIERGMADQAAAWHKQLQVPHLPEPNDIVQCFNSVFDIYINYSRPTPGSIAQEEWLASRMNAFQRVCEHIDGHRIYSQVIPVLTRWGEFTEAFRMHTFLAIRDDHAQCFAELQPLLDDADEFGPRLRYQRLQRYASDRFPNIASTNSEPAPEPPQEPDTSHWFEEKRFKDDFGARIFATKALNFDMIVSGLKMFAVAAIGPQSLREMAARTHGSDDLREKLERLEKEGISIGTTVFARLLRRLAIERRETLLSDLIQSDQHPAMFEDVGSQERLLLSYYSGRDWRQYNLTIAILKELLGEGSDYNNIHLRKHILAGEWALAYNVLDGMLTYGFAPSEKSMRAVRKYILTYRKPGSKPVGPQNPDAENELTFAFLFLQRVVKAGGDVPTDVWNELIKRFGMSGSWEALRNCLLWLARHYSTPSTDLSSGHVLRGKQMLKRLFSPEVLDAIVTWGFIVPRVHTEESYRQIEIDGKLVVPYVRGVKLLRELETAGIHVWLGRARQACRQRLLVLYGPPAYKTRRQNQRLRRLNPYTVERVIADINQVWCWPPLPPLLDEAVTVESITRDVSQDISRDVSQESILYDD
ncbi:hypothetical protein BDV12DRAFT_161297 [Aspergillus spectabilis]